MIEGIVVTEATPERLVELGNKRIIEIVGIWFVLPKESRWAWMRSRGWGRAITTDRWDHSRLGCWKTEDEVFKIELSQALFNARSLA